MSTVAQPDVVDWLGIDHDGNISLTVVDDLDWSDELRHLWLLQEKLNSYLAFIESGEVFESVLEQFGRRPPETTPIKVAVVASCELPARARAFMDHAIETFRGAGFALDHQVVAVP